MSASPAVTALYQIISTVRDKLHGLTGNAGDENNASVLKEVTGLLETVRDPNAFDTESWDAAMKQCGITAKFIKKDHPKYKDVLDAFHSIRAVSQNASSSATPFDTESWNAALAKCGFKSTDRVKKDHPQYEKVLEAFRDIRNGK